MSNEVEVEIEVDTWINSWEQGIDKLHWNITKLKENNKVILDMKNVTFLRPAGIVSLSLVCINIYERTFNKVVIKSIKSDVYLYMQRVNFFNVNNDFVIANESPLELSFNWLQEYYNYNANVKLMTVNNVYNFMELSGEISMVLDNWLPNSRYTLYKSNIQTALIELCNNSLEHSGSDVFFILQKYKNQWIEICVGDLGIGISEHMRRKHRWIVKKDVEFIEQAMQGVSGRPEGDGGAGLCTIQKLVKEYNGELKVKSQKGLINLNGHNKYVKREFYHGFPGTQCHVLFKTI